MFKGLKQRLDQFAIELACRSLPPSNPRPDQLAEARAILADPGYLKPPGMPAIPEFSGDHEFHFESAVQLPCSATNQAYGALYRAGPGWESKPLVLLVHGWNAELQYRHELPLIARSFNRRGMNAALLQLPFHGARRPRRPEVIRDFISDDVPVMLRATHQALSDIHSFLLWAKITGCPAVGLWGFSFGAWLTGLHLGYSSLQEVAVLTTPVCDMQEAIAGLAFCEPIRSALGPCSLDLSRLNLTSYLPRIPPHRILITQSNYDLFVPARTIEALRQAWNTPEIWQVQHGHISVLLSWPVLRRTIGWVTERLAPAGP